jgi:hypothetical protein
MTRLDHFTLLNDLKKLLERVDGGDMEQVRSDLEWIIQQVQKDCDEEQRIYLERVERYMDHVDNALKDKEQK